jgi:hypothetical protein
MHANYGLKARRSTSQVEVTNVSPHGFWLFVGEQELFVSFKEFPWFKDASIGEISRMELPSAHHLCWPGPRHRSGSRLADASGAVPLGQPGAAQAPATDEGASASGDEAGESAARSRLKRERRAEARKAARRDLGVATMLPRPGLIPADCREREGGE